MLDRSAVSPDDRWCSGKEDTLSIFMDFALWWIIPCWVYVACSAATFCKMKPSAASVIFHPAVVGSRGRWHLAAQNVISSHFMLKLFWFWCEVDCWSYLHSWFICPLFPLILHLLFSLWNVCKIGKMSLNPKLSCLSSSVSLILFEWIWIQISIIM